ncbi:hypothetical protein K443DRAFT_592750 [Laccaria amethystina LaAM-08-1]|uniref:Secreted protein n=1 Tax=Laccaria amethystina LaAM-08-1 TaxID=1095629 RepID=A0A0C9XYM6_9AGAR|nr:hypothetical protein K443DRAFT_592750 [Laccaria amethystina LaAM-08-1]
MPGLNFLTLLSSGWVFSVNILLQINSSDLSKMDCTYYLAVNDVPALFQITQDHRRSHPSREYGPTVCVGSCSQTRIALGAI